MELNGVLSSKTDRPSQYTSIWLGQPNTIRTPYGDFVPRHSKPDYRRRDGASLTLYANGSLRSIELEEQTAVVTPQGDWEAEFVLFYEEGPVMAVFPRNGKLGFGWTQKDEGEILERHNFNLSFGSFSAKVINLRFHKSGALRSVTLWPGETVALDTPAGKIKVRTGFTLHEDGSLRSVEPATPTPVETPAGMVTAYNPMNSGIDATMASLVFDASGDVAEVTTGGVIEVHDRATGVTRQIASALFAGLSESTVNMKPLRVSFKPGHATIDDTEKAFVFDLANCDFRFDFDAKATLSMTCEGECDDE
jgi:hypothetical protein